MCFEKRKRGSHKQKVMEYDARVLEALLGKLVTNEAGYLHEDVLTCFVEAPMERAPQPTLKHRLLRPDEEARQLECLRWSFSLNKRALHCNVCACPRSKTSCDQCRKLPVRFVCPCTARGQAAGFVRLSVPNSLSTSTQSTKWLFETASSMCAHGAVKCLQRAPI